MNAEADFALCAQGAEGAATERTRWLAVAVEAPMREALSYTLKDPSAPDSLIGCRVLVPLGPRRVLGVVVEETNCPPAGLEARKVKAIDQVLERQPSLDSGVLRLLKAAASYYQHPLGEVIACAMPPLERSSLSTAATQPAVARIQRQAISLFPRGTTKARYATVPGSDSKPRRPHIEAALAWLALQPEASAEELAAQGLGTNRLRVLCKEGVIRKLAPSPPSVDSAIDAVLRQPLRSPVAPKTLTRDQAEAVADLDALRLEGQGQTALLQGVTGSGKTEVYLQLAKRSLAQGQGVLILAPEIALTPQLFERFEASLQTQVAVFHSEVSPRDRLLRFEALRRGRCRVALGARSAIFAPVQQLGLVVVDEEHDGAYKQEEGFRYNARDLAMLRAKQSGALCVLGSATPSLETLHRCRRGQVGRVSLPERVTGKAAPQVEVVDLRLDTQSKARIPWLTRPLEQALERCIDAGEQAILYLNRRGFAHAAQCRQCGEIQTCPTCAVSLCWHRASRELRCHVCGFARRVGDARDKDETEALGKCQACGVADLSTQGLGTERIVRDLEEAFPAWRIARLDRDTAQRRGSGEHILRSFREGEADLLVGTQMVTKGHDIPTVTLVGIVLADLALHFPDFRASERALQSLLQVAGRAGRADKPGEVILQSYQPEHPVIRACVSGTYVDFAQGELLSRKELDYPPYQHAAMLRLSAPELHDVEVFAAQVAAAAARLPQLRRGEVRARGPVAAPLSRAHGRFRFQLLLTAGERKALRQALLALKHTLGAVRAPRRLSIDVDPYNMS